MLWNEKSLTAFNNVVLFQIFVLLLLVSFISCRKENIDQVPENPFSFEQPDYPKKPAGRYLQHIIFEHPGDGYSGTKMAFTYDEKNYVQSYLIRDLDQNQIIGYTTHEYDILGNATLIKHFNQDTILIGYQNVEWDLSGRFTKISNYEKSNDSDEFSLTKFTEYEYVLPDSIIERRYIEHYNFELTHTNIFLVDSAGNIVEKIKYFLDETYPYAADEFCYSNNKRIFEHQDLPLYRTSVVGFGLTERLSNNTQISYRYFTFENDTVKVPLGDATQILFEYDEFGYPESRSNMFYYYYEDLE